MRQSSLEGSTSGGTRGRATTLGPQRALKGMVEILLAWALGRAGSCPPVNRVQI